MQYYCLVYLNEAEIDAMSQAERDAMVNAALDNDEALRQSGHYLDSNALQAPKMATSVRVRDGKLLVTDGPFAETKEHLSGLIHIEARDLNEAIRIAATIPMAREGTIEVRPVEMLTRIERKG
jgi:hypothetical protein